MPSLRQAYHVVRSNRGRAAAYAYLAERIQDDPDYVIGKANRLSGELPRLRDRIKAQRARCEGAEWRAQLYGDFRRIRGRRGDDGFRTFVTERLAADQRRLNRARSDGVHEAFLSALFPAEGNGHHGSGCAVHNGRRNSPRSNYHAEVESERKKLAGLENRHDAMVDLLRAVVQFRSSIGLGAA